MYLSYSESLKRKELQIEDVFWIPIKPELHP